MYLTGALAAAAILNSAAYTPPRDYAVREGDTLTGVASRFQVSSVSLARNNPWILPDAIQPGTVLRVPAKFSGRMILASNPGPTSSKYVVRNGDNDWTIARKLGITPTTLHRVNPGVVWQRLQPGQELRIPGQMPAPQAPALTQAIARPASTRTHEVRQGENDWVIASRYSISASKLHAANPGVRWDRLQIGQKLSVPVSGAGVPSITTARARVARDGVNVRSKPDAASMVIASVDTSRTARVLDRKGDWYKVGFSSTTGWIRGDLLRSVSAAEAAKIQKQLRIASNAAPKRSKVAAATKSAPKLVASAKPAPRNARPSGSNSPKVGSSLVSTALAQLGTRYVWAGTARGGFDCSGLTTWVYRQHGKSIARRASLQAKQGEAVSKANLAPGDLVFFKTLRSTRINHVGMYIGDGKFVHASSGAGKVKVDSINQGYYSRRLAAARRIVASKSAPASASTARKSSSSTKSSAKPTPQAEAKPEEPKKRADGSVIPPPLKGDKLAQ